MKCVIGLITNIKNCAFNDQNNKKMLTKSIKTNKNGLVLAKSDKSFTSSYQYTFKRSFVNINSKFIII